jgi:[ribosomal protein S5]-alanine N-acetyltransferase
MPRPPSIGTARLRLRAFRAADAETVQRLAGDRNVADTTLNIPHPYEDGLAEKWISNHRDWFDRRQQAVFAITLPGPPETLIGAVELRIEREDKRGELGYWVGTPYQRQGYATEAARALAQFGFEAWGLHRVTARCFSRNRASQRVLQKIGMAHEGRLRQHINKWGVFEDIDVYGILAEEWRTADADLEM